MPAKSKKSKSKTKKTQSKTRNTKKSDFLDRMKSQLEGMKASGSQGRFWKPSEPRQMIRIFEFESDGEIFTCIEDKTHWRIDPRQSGSNVPCLGSNCAICDLKDSLPDKTWNRIKPSRKILVNAVVRKLDGKKDQQVVAQLPATVAEKILEYAAQFAEEDGENVFDYKHGRDFRITKTGEGLKTRYDVTPSGKTSDIGVSVTSVDLFTKLRKTPSSGEYERMAEMLEEEDD